MKPKLKSRIALALLAIASIHQAQTPVQKPVASGAAASTTLEPDVPLRCGVTGLTRENSSAIQAALTALTVQVFACDACKVEQARTGSCTKCTGPLQAATKPMLSGATATPDDASITLSLNPRRLARLSEIEAALKKGGVAMDATQLPLPGRIILVVKGGVAEDAASVEKALREARLFEEVVASFDGPSREIRVRARCGTTTPPSRAGIAEVLSGRKLQLADVFFGGSEQG